MGYSFTTPCKSVKARDKMLWFLEEHYRSWGQIIAPLQTELTDGRGFSPLVSFETRARGPLSDDLSYDHGECKIGFDYGAGFSESERYWMYNFCYWMAQRVGHRRSFSKKAPGCGAVPYVVYDGYQAWPVLEASEYRDTVGEENEWLVENGFRGMEHEIHWEMGVHKQRSLEEGKKPDSALLDWFEERLRTARVVDAVIKAELDRLSELWNDREEHEET